MGKKIFTYIIILELHTTYRAYIGEFSHSNLSCHKSIVHSNLRVGQTYSCDTDFTSQAHDGIHIVRLIDPNNHLTTDGL